MLDLVVYGASAGGLAASVAMRRLGGSVRVLEPTAHVGGMTTGGLGHTDTGQPGREAAIGGIAREFYDRVGGFDFPPSAAQRVVAELLAEAGVPPVLTGQRIDHVDRDGPRLTALHTDDGGVHEAHVFLDASYEGDLMAAADVAFTVGREANSVYGESLNGYQLHATHQFDRRVDPYRVPGDPASGLLPEIGGGGPAVPGSGDDRVQAYNFRLCLTQAPERVPFTRPRGYDPARYALLARLLEAGYDGPFFLHDPVETRDGRVLKTDSNNGGPFSTDFIGGSRRYPTATWTERERIVAAHRDYLQGFLYFLTNDPAVPADVRAREGAWGLARDEFTATGNWPPQLYVREARRMRGRHVVTEHDATGARSVPDAIGLAVYNMDSHHAQRLVVDGAVRNEGDVQMPVQPYGVAYRALTPHAEQCTNLLVPVCLSASHIAYGSIRMEPVFMILCQSAATAARLAIDAGTSVQDVDVARLQSTLRAQGQHLMWRR